MRDLPGFARFQSHFISVDQAVPIPRELSRIEQARFQIATAISQAHRKRIYINNRSHRDTYWKRRDKFMTVANTFGNGDIKFSVTNVDGPASARPRPQR